MKLKFDKEGGEVLVDALDEVFVRYRDDPRPTRDYAELARRNLRIAVNLRMKVRSQLDAPAPDAKPSRQAEIDSLRQEINDLRQRVTELDRAVKGWKDRFSARG